MKRGDEESKKDIFIPPKTDLVFKRIFGSEKTKGLLIDFLNSFLPEPVEQLSYMNAELPKESLEEKLSRLDILARLQGNKLINIEIQLSHLRVFPERSLYYGSKVYAEQLKERAGYRSIKPVLCINILDFTLEANRDVDDCHTVYNFRRSDGKLMTKALEFRFIELPKSARATGRFKLWLDFIRSENEEEMAMAGRQDELVEKAQEVYRGLVSGAESDLFLQRYKDLMDRQTLEQEALEKGIEQGMERGMEKGMEKGKAQLIASMSRKGLSISEIAALSELTEEEVKALLEQAQ